MKSYFVFVAGFVLAHNNFSQTAKATPAPCGTEEVRDPRDGTCYAVGCNSPLNVCREGLECGGSARTCYDEPTDSYDWCPEASYGCREPGPSACRLDVKVIGITNLLNTPSFFDRTSDPRVTVRAWGDPLDVNGVEFFCQTQVKKNNLNPVFNYQCQSTAYSGGNQYWNGYNHFVEIFIADDNFFLDSIMNTASFRPTALAETRDPLTYKLIRDEQGNPVVDFVQGASCPDVRQKSCDQTGKQTITVQLEDGAYSANPDSYISFEYCFYNPNLESEPAAPVTSPRGATVSSGEDNVRNFSPLMNPAGIAIIVSSSLVVLVVAGAVGYRRTRKQSGDVEEVDLESFSPQFNPRVEG